MSLLSHAGIQTLLIEPDCGRTSREAFMIRHGIFMNIVSILMMMSIAFALRKFVRRIAITSIASDGLLTCLRLL